MKKISFLVLLPAMVVLFVSLYEEGFSGKLQDVKARGKIVVGVKIDFPPFGFVDKTGMNKGFDIDLARALGRELLRKKGVVEFVPVTSENRISLLTRGKVDIILASMTITEERKKEINFSIPYFVSGHLILVHKSSEITKYQDLAGKKVATVQGTTGDIAIKELAPAAERVVFRDNFNALKALKARRVEAFVQDDVLIENLAEKNADLKIASLTPFRPAPYGIGIRKEDKELLEFVDATLTNMKNIGEFQKLLRKWFNKPISLLVLKLLKEFEGKGERS